MIGRQTHEVTKIVPGEPSGEYFTIPTGYTERAPSAVLREADEQRGSANNQAAVRCLSCNELTNQRLDSGYFQALQGR